MNRTIIEWADYTWNPIFGCKHNCSYCYAKQLNNRFKFIPDWNEPKLFMTRLYEPLDLKKQATIFVGSMSDVMGGWIEESWIEAIIEVCRNCPQHRFMFLTKNPVRYGQFDFPMNCWLGLTVTSYPKHPVMQWEWRFQHAFLWAKKHLHGHKIFVSIEPIMSSFEGCDLSMYDLVIVGAMTGARAIKTDPKWIQSVHHHNIVYKKSAIKLLQENIKNEPER